MSSAPASTSLPADPAARSLDSVDSAPAARSLDSAVAALLSHTQIITDTESVDLWHTENRVLAEPARAVYDYPPFSRSAMDGYALRATDIVGASPEHPVTLTVIDEVCAGHVSGKEVTPGTAIRIMTGAPIPTGADCVIMQEKTDMGGTILYGSGEAHSPYKTTAPDETCPRPMDGGVIIHRFSESGMSAFHPIAEGIVSEKDDAQKQVLVHAPETSGRNICPRGEDYRAGAELLPAGTLLRSGETGILAGLGMDRVPVYRRPRVALLTTGDETVLPGRPLAPGKIYDSNLYTAGTALRSFGAELIGCESIPDAPETLADRLRTLAKSSDLLVTTGGVSVGKKDIMHEVLPLLPARKLFWKIAMKPGMPTLCGLYQGKPLVCLSGNPYGVFVGIHLIVRPLIARLSRREDLIPVPQTAFLQQDFPKASPVTRYLRGTLHGNQVFFTDGSQDNGNLRSLRGCSCLVEIPAGTSRIERGEPVTVIPI